MRMPDGDGLKVMSGIRTLAPETAVIFLTAYGSVPEAVKAMKGGACDYLVKPISFEQLQEAALRFLRWIHLGGGARTIPAESLASRFPCKGF